MRPVLILLLVAGALAACDNPVANQAAVDTRHDPVRADSMVAIGFRPGVGALDTAQLAELRSMVAAGRASQRDEFTVVTDGSGGNLQNMRAQHVRQSLSSAGARWVSTTVEPAMAMGPDQVVVVRSQYRIGEFNCPNHSPASIGNPSESAKPGFGCADAYNMGQMLARPRDAAVGREPGPADGTVAADAIQRYREGRVRSVNSSGISGASPMLSGGGGSSSPTPPPAN